MALLAIILITVGWWALALYPLGADAPTWVTRTRAACFGAVDDALPSAGGWLLLIGEPIGMAAVLVVVWGASLRSDLQAIIASWWGRALLLVLGGSLAVGAWAAAARVAAATADTFAVSDPAGGPVRLDAPAPPMTLIDQHGEPFVLADQRGERVIVTFAFAHCADICPTLVHELRRARDAAPGARVPIVVVTLDPWRDTPARLPTIAQQWELPSGDRVLSGEVDQVNRVLDAWSVGRSRDATTGAVDHAAVAYLVDARGRLAARLDGGMDRMRDVLAEGER